MANFKDIFLEFLQRIKIQVPRKVAQIVQNDFIDNFKNQSFDGQKWEKRKDNDTNRNLLVKTGELRRSIRIARATWEKIIIASDVPYAKIHNEGGVTHPKVTAKMRAMAWENYKNTGNALFKGIALTKKASLTVPIPKRQFMGMNTNLERKIRDGINAELKNIFFGSGYNKSTNRSQRR